jgi:hypothetical protein
VIAAPLINVLLPFQACAWDARRRKIPTAHGSYMMLICEKLSQAGMHAGVAFGVMLWNKVVRAPMESLRLSVA